MFKGYFNIEFPKEIRKEIKDSFMYRDFYEESIELTPTEPNKSQIELTPTEPNKSQITLSKELERKVESQELAIGIKAKSQDNKDFVENIDKEPTNTVGD
ncbi:hypothetical protein EfmAA242_35210 (plasmid) [Enterococcus faecium]|nr:hypothetical protein EfmAA242_35210 [Enterococcus faecium]